MYLSSTQESTKFTKDAAVQTIILASSYFGAMLLAGKNIVKLKASPVNPAIAFGLCFYNWEGNWKTALLFLLPSLGGSLISLFFFTKIY